MPIVIHTNPKYVYQKTDEGYEIIYYVSGINLPTKITIPSSHNNINVTSIDNQAFSNMFYLKEVEIPNTILLI